MQTIKELYRIGFGPSSSHTMAPSNAASIILSRYQEAQKFEITLYNSLALTGKGHLTDEAIIKALPEKEVIFKFEIDKDKHPNTMIFKVFNKDNTEIASHEVLSVGGGKIVFVGEEESIPNIYPQGSFKEISKYCKDRKINLYQYVKVIEGDEIDDFLYLIWETMKESIKRGLMTQGILPGNLKVVRKAPSLITKKLKNEVSEITENRLISAYAFAVNEENASGGKIVTAPTCGACGVLPAVLYYMQEKHHFSDQKIIEALATASVFGNLIKHNASISGAVAGCQAEVGSACSMAAAAHASLFNLSIDKQEYAAEIAMEHHLGLTCDPVNGFVQIPCIERNAVAALRAVDACGLAFFLSDSRKISFDTVIETMYQTGLDMHSHYKETSEGGLAKYYKENDNDVNCW
ncbi:L-serine dehydratase, iron-sulfur-dependent, single chain form [Alteracholeplasma palmae J233]|uniref:L-serine dehydratase n=1 Tax=Alteracholeplasma palmae (strain ATCC 49389 / J233) TaxID=1318466 RepID=U4KKJ6_ALTPJ|nr:L-serine ammonia-lyase [Alteracholeplasma palmae]CCV64147.1 L-serine dehydratase, iron-sulfur-dependent, single chain form [Alteracholeplasma palmae J233]